MARISIDLAEPGSTFAMHFPRTGVVVRDIPSARQRGWRLVRLDETLHSQGKPNEWLLVRSEPAPAPDGPPAPVDMLLVGAVPRVADGFDESSFARIGAALISPVHLNLTRRQRFWARFSLVVIVLAAAGWYFWNFNPESWSGRLVGRLLFLIPEMIK
jgi:hypothetical protein